MVDEIVNLYSKINDIYLKMMELELSEKANSNEFIVLVKLLKDTVIKEQELLNGLSYDEYDILLDSLGDEVDSLSMRLYNYIELYKNMDALVSSEDIKIRRVYNVCAKNIFLVYMSFLQEKIDSMPQYREGLLKYKYLNSFTNHDVELDLISNNYCMMKDIDVDLYVTTEIIGIDSDISDSTIMTCYLDALSEIIPELMFICDEDYILDEEKIVWSIHCECMIRACLALLDNKDYGKVKEKIDLVIKNLANGRNHVSEEIIRDICSERMNDKRRVRVISFGPLND